MIISSNNYVYVSNYKYGDHTNLWSYKHIYFKPSSAIRPAQQAAPGKNFSGLGMIGSTTSRPPKNHLKKLVNIYNKT